MTQTHKPFVFELNFDADIVASVTEVIHPDLIKNFNQSDITKEKKISFEEGRRIGFEEGIVSGELRAITASQKNIQHVLEGIDNSLKLIVEQTQSTNQTLTKAVHTIMASILERLVPNLNAEFGSTRIRNGLWKILEELRVNHTLLCHCHPEQEEEIRHHITAATQKFGCAIDISLDDSLSMNQFKLSWSDGGALWDMNKLNDSILSLFRKEA